MPFRDVKQKFELPMRLLFRHVIRRVSPIERQSKRSRDDGVAYPKMTNHHVPGTSGRMGRRRPEEARGEF
jgi:hypothetical protein